MAIIYTTVYKSPLGKLVLESDGKSLTRLRLPGGTWYRVHTADWAAQYGVTTAKTEHAEGEEPPAGG